MKKPRAASAGGAEVVSLGNREFDLRARSATVPTARTAKWRPGRGQAPRQTHERGESRPRVCRIASASSCPAWTSSRPTLTTRRRDQRARQVRHQSVRRPKPWPDAACVTRPHPGKRRGTGRINTPSAAQSPARLSALPPRGGERRRDQGWASTSSSPPVAPIAGPGR